MKVAVFISVSLATLGALAQPPADAPAQRSSLAQCATCHGARGEGNAAMSAPRIAAQPQEYLLRQLNAFTDGSRPSAVMTPIAKALDANAKKLAAAYYGDMSAPPVMAPASEADSERGRSLATMGDGDRRIQACINCHGPEGSGLPPVTPYLAGQQSAYLVASLKTWKDGTRKTDPTGQMPAIASRLSDTDMQSLARYFAARMPPVPTAPMATRSPHRPSAPGSRPRTAEPRGVETQGAGTEQGAGTTGGGQGPGGGGGTKTAP